MNTPPDFRYERYAPGAPLAEYIEHFWIVSAAVGNAERREILVPNGRPVIIVNLGHAGERIDPVNGETRANDSAVTGIATRPVIIGQRGQSKLVAAQPTPFGLSALDCPHLIDAQLDMSDWIGAEQAGKLHDAVAEAPFGEPAARILEAFLGERLVPLPARTLERLKTAIARMEGEDGQTDLRTLAADMELSHDRLYREFRRHTGITPKAMSAIIRYQRLIGGLLSGQPGDGLAQLALMQGYYDQAHANREFRRFTGTTPSQFRQTLNGIARMMHRS